MKTLRLHLLFALALCIPATVLADNEPVNTQALPADPAQEFMIRDYNRLRDIDQYLTGVLSKIDYQKQEFKASFPDPQIVRMLKRSKTKLEAYQSLFADDVNQLMLADPAAKVKVPMRKWAEASVFGDQIEIFAVYADELRKLSIEQQSAKAAMNAERMKLEAYKRMLQNYGEEEASKRWIVHDERTIPSLDSPSWRVHVGLKIRAELLRSSPNIQPGEFTDRLASFQLALLDHLAEDSHRPIRRASARILPRRR